MSKNEASVRAGQGFTILVVGDDPGNLGVLEKILEEHNCRVLFAHNGITGIERAGNDQPDLILMEVMMPGMDGFETCRRLKANEETRDIPLILMTEIDEKEKFVKGFNSGAADYIIKPFLSEEIAARIRAHLFFNSAEKQLELSNIRLAQEIEKRRQAEAGLKKHKEQLEKHIQAERSLQLELTLNKALEKLCNPLLNPTKSIVDIRKAVLKQAKDLTQSIQGYVSEIDPVNGDNIVHAFYEMMNISCNVQKAEERKMRFPRGEDGRYPGLWGHCLNTRKSFYTNSPEGHPASKGCTPGHFPIERFLSAPVMLADEPVGQIALANKKGDYTDQDLAAICRLGELYAFAVQREQWEKALWESEKNKLEEADRMRRALLSILEDETLSKKKIKASLQEKEVLLREIHHRVKNNLQIVSSLLQLQTGYATDEQTVRMFNESQMQIRTMALVHEKLYRSDDMSMVDFSDFVKSITENLFQFYPNSLGRIRFTVEIENIYMSIDKAIPCGMIINELVSNSFKYGFPGESAGEIGIRLVSGAQKGFELTVYDTGIGIPANVDYRHTETLGLHLVTILTEDQLQGQIELDKSDGTKFRIQF